MAQQPVVRALSDADLHAAPIVPARPVNLRRDLYQFVKFVQAFGLTRTHRENTIPKSAARKLARLLSYQGEAQAVEEVGAGFWSDTVSQVARAMGLVTFNTKGVYAGYTSTSETYPDNQINVDPRAWTAYLRTSPREKERAILHALVQMTPNEFFHAGTLVPGEPFDAWGSATGPASRMTLPAIRRALIDILASLGANVWYDTRSFVEVLAADHHHAILDPALCGPTPESANALRSWEWEATQAKRRRQKDPPKPVVVSEDIYVNFREFERGTERDFSRRKEQQIASRTKGAFSRVEGRYVERFLAEIPYLAGFVDLAFCSPNDPHGREVVPEYERLRAFRLTPWFFAVIGGESQIQQVNVTALPNFEIVIDALSYPESTLAELEPYTILMSEDGPVHRLRLDRARVIEAAASSAPPATEVVGRITGRPVPANVAAELDSWGGHGQKLIFFGDDVALLELAAEAAPRVLDDLQAHIVDSGEAGFVFIRDAERAFGLLERKLHMPARVKHPERAFAAGWGADGKPAETAAAPCPARRPAVKTQLQAEDLVGFRSPQRALLQALHRALHEDAGTCLLAEDLLVLSAAALPRLRAALRALSGRYAVELTARPALSTHVPRSGRAGDSGAVSRQSSRDAEVGSLKHVTFQDTTPTK